MNQPTHIDMTLAAADIVGWKGDRKLVARSAAVPDQVRTVEIDGLGCHFAGLGFGPFVHFVRPVPTERGFHYVGYNFKLDGSMPHIDLPNRRVIPHPEAWGWPLTPEMIEKEPLKVLVDGLCDPAHRGSIMADELTFSTAAVMAGYFTDDVYRKFPFADPLELQRAKDTVAGYICHFVEDPAVPHHGMGWLLRGHQAFEGDVQERWIQIRSKNLIDEYVRKAEGWHLTDTKHPRQLAEDNCYRSQVSARRLCYYRYIWRRGWNGLVEACVVRGLGTAIAALRYLQT